MQTHSEAVADRLRDMVLRGALAPETHLQEIPIAEMVGVSRTPVRAALATLASEGLLDYAPNRGYRVRRFTLEEIESAHEVRAMLEGMACRVAAERGLTRETEAALQDALATGDAILAKGRLVDGDREPWSEMNDRFHTAILDAAGNRVLSDLVGHTQRFPLASSRVIHWYDYEAIKGSHELHHRIFRYIADGRPTRAEALMREHIYQAIDQIRARTGNVEDGINDALRVLATP